MKNIRSVFNVIYIVSITIIVLLSVNLFLNIIAIPTYFLPLMLVVGSLMFFTDAIMQRKTRNTKASR